MPPAPVTTTAFTAFLVPVAEADHLREIVLNDPEVVASALRTLLEGSAAEAFVGYPEKLAVRLNGLDWRDGGEKWRLGDRPNTSGSTRTTPG